MSQGPGDSGNNYLEHTLGLSPKGRTAADRLGWISLMPSRRSHKIFYCMRYLPTTHIYNSLPATKPTKRPQTLHLNFLQTHSHFIPMVHPSLALLLALFFFFQTCFVPLILPDPSPGWLTLTFLLSWRAFRAPCTIILCAHFPASF